MNTHQMRPNGHYHFFPALYDRLIFVTYNEVLGIPFQTLLQLPIFKILYGHLIHLVVIVENRKLEINYA